MASRFNSRSRERATGKRISRRRQVAVSIHALVRERRQYHQRTTPRNVSIHALVRERRTSIAFLPFLYLVSIHALVRERHRVVYFGIDGTVVSIHALVRERQPAALRSSTRRCFNSRSRERATYALVRGICGQIVSIHALVRERRSI